jgi:ppGpp synthetase/RelA/SpoT-type nucleotidyltranferase
VIDTFIARYVREYDFYDRAARLVKKRLEPSLKTVGVRCLVTSRTKDISRLEEKYRQRDRSRHYTSADQILEDIADLAGVRVAPYFPAERHQVDSAINNLFRLFEPQRDFPNSESPGHVSGSLDTRPHTIVYSFERMDLASQRAVTH